MDIGLLRNSGIAPGIPATISKLPWKLQPLCTLFLPARIRYKIVKSTNPAIPSVFCYLHEVIQDFLLVLRSFKKVYLFFFN